MAMDFGKFLEENSIVHRFKESRDTKSSRDAADTTGVALDSIIKTLVFEAGECCLVIARAPDRVSTRKLKKLLGVPDAKLASPARVLEETGYEAGAVPPFGHSKKLRTILDRKVLGMEHAWAGGGTKTRIVELKIGDVMKFAAPEVADVTE
jgi:prolyl-tRNA editing enzyme YbaK/EbsC (Cys-tRNA(Pro) deacylase)